MDDLYGAIAEKLMDEDGIIDEESLHQWFKGGGWRQAGGKYDGKPCARQKGQKTTPKCVSRKKYSSMSKKQRDSAGRRKRKKDPNQTKKSGAAKPTYVKTDPQKGGRKKKKKSKKNEELYMNLEQIVREELENVLNEIAYEPGRAVSGIDAEIEKEDSLDMQSVNDQLLSDLQDLGMDWIMDDEKMYRTLDRLKADSNSSGEYQQKIIDFLNNNAGELGYAGLGDEVLNESILDEKRKKNKKKGKKDDKEKKELKGLAGETYEKTAADYKKNPEYFNEGSIDEKKKKGGKKDACYHKVKSRYKVWPSAYASGALVKCRKVGAKNWGNSKKESIMIEFENQLVENELYEQAEKFLDESLYYGLFEENEVLDEKKKKKKGCTPAKGKKYARRVKGRCVSYGAKGYSIAPGTSKGNSYCARSYGDMKSHGKDCSGKDRSTPLCLSRKKWKCSGKYSRKGK